MDENYSSGLITPGVRAEMLGPGFWIARTVKAREVIMSWRQIEEFNREVIRQVEAVCDLRGYKECLGRDELTAYINSYPLPDKILYDARGREVTGSFYSLIAGNRNIGRIKAKNPVKWGIAVKKTALRSFPAAAGVYDTRDNIEIDRFQETGVRACEPLLILHRSKDKRWCFVQTGTYRGWVRAGDIAAAANKEELIYLDAPGFLVVTGNWAGEYDMGTRLPVVDTRPEDYIVKIPVRAGNGGLLVKNAVISKVEDVSWGYLSYTRENILKQAFKLLGDRYDWGNKFKGRDCSSFIQAVYKSFGFNLPRNAGEQERGPGRVCRFGAGDSIAARNAVLDWVKPGAALYMPGHVMMYLGRVAGEHYVIHAFTGYGDPFVPVFQAAVTSTLLPAAAGGTFLEKLTSVLQFEQDIVFGLPE